MHIRMRRCKAHFPPSEDADTQAFGPCTARWKPSLESTHAARLLCILSTTCCSWVSCTDPCRPSLEAMLEDYWQLMPQYQGLQSMDQVEVLRILFGFFPTYRASPLSPGWDRTLQVAHSAFRLQ